MLYFFVKKINKYDVDPTVCQLPPEKMPSHQFFLTQVALNPPSKSRVSKKIHLTPLTPCVLFSIKTWMETQLLIESPMRTQTAEHHGDGS